MRDHGQEFRRKGAAIAAIGLGDANYARAFREEAKIDFPLLIDEHAQAYRAVRLKKASLLHLLRSDNAAARKRAKAAGYSQHRLGKDPFQLGGSFVFAPDNVDLFTHISETFGDNAAPETILASIPDGLNRAS